MYQNCMFCALNYDFIGHLETIDSDMPYLWHLLTGQPAASMPFKMSTDGPSFDKHLKMRLLRKVNNKSLIRNALERHKIDYDFLHGYEIENDIAAI